MKPITPIWLLLALAAPLAASEPPAQNPPPPVAVRPPRPKTLADALAALPPRAVPRDRVLLAVGADRAYYLPPRRPDDAPLAGPPQLPPLGSPGAAAEAFGRVLLPFGGVMAFAPPTMTILNPDPALAQIPLAELVTTSPLPFLLGTLTPEQWRRLGSDGLGLSDLSADQKSLLQAALPTPLEVVASSAKSPMLDGSLLEKATPDEQREMFRKAGEARKVYDAQKRTVGADEMGGLRLHASLDASYTFDVPGQQGYGIGISPTPGYEGFQGAGALKLSEDARYGFGRREEKSKRLGALFKADVPNALKAADWRWDTPTLYAEVSLVGVKTVGELVQKCAAAAKLELHCPAGWASQSVLALGERAARPVTVRDALRALCLALTATVRRVSPAYVLTGDLTSLPVQKARLMEITKVWEKRLDDAQKQIGGRMGEVGWKNLLTFAPGDPGALPPDLLKRVAAGGAGTFGTDISLAALPPSIRSGLSDNLEAQKKRGGLGSSVEKIQAALKADSPVGISLNLRFAIEIPGSGLMTLGDVYRPQMPDKAPSPDATPPVPAKKPRIVEANRGVLCAPTSPEAARAVVQKLSQLGFNTLYCAAFSNGRAYFPNDALPPETNAAGQTLTAAIDEGKKRGVSVWAEIDTLCWKRDGAATHPKPFPAGFAPDVTVLGETGPQTLARRAEFGSLGRYENPKWLGPTAGSEVWVSPADPRVREMLKSLVKTLSGVKGLAGIAFDKTGTSGYVETSDHLDSAELGYTFANRLTFLRARHADPLDLGDGYSGVYFSAGGGGASIDLPQTQMADKDTYDAWKAWRSDADTSLMTELFQTVKAAAPKLPLVMRERKIGVTYDAWTDAKRLNEAANLLAEGDALGKHTTPQSVRVSLFSVYQRIYPQAVGESLTETAPGGLRTSAVVLDLLTGTVGGDPMRELDAVEKQLGAKP